MKWQCSPREQPITTINDYDYARKLAVLVCVAIHIISIELLIRMLNIGCEKVFPLISINI